MKTVLVAVAGLTWLVAGASARADCANPPEPVRAWFSAHPGWQVQTLEGWDRDSIAEWRKIHKDDCPGFAVADLDGKGRSYGLLARHQAGGKSQIQAVSVQRRGGKLMSQVLQAPYNSGAEILIAHAGAGRYQDQYNFRKYRLPHEGFVIGEWDAGAVLYYLSNGRIKHFTFSE